MTQSIGKGDTRRCNQIPDNKEVVLTDYQMATYLYCMLGQGVGTVIIPSYHTFIPHRHNCQVCCRHERDDHSVGYVNNQEQS
jgi:hypothetical protein